ncbi:hypothetical protein HBI52_002470 [Parastagonospora nodorum]|nr:hypothetical protein HBI78_149350 [Parastagonospora nodorum]KAH5057604.1 hypothetical protein HBH96_107730 [Parastagonospora nodorum]KAH5356544.1 hypothetical protein HBI48_126640 [Parastagonospora nodorum]KAH5532726.1 hypothetical protein HBI52_002470 [Parastagonospora nodorum]KAH6035137.1 hypothetical protein HBI83_002450 [Parastagonospora nodorum]
MSRYFTRSSVRSTVNTGDEILDLSLDTSLENESISSINPVTLRNQQESPLLQLPGELRNKIYEYIFNPLAIECNRWTVFAGSMDSERPWNRFLPSEMREEEWQNGLWASGSYKSKPNSDNFRNRLPIMSQLFMSRVFHQIHAETVQLIIPKAVFYFTDSFAFRILQRATTKALNAAIAAVRLSLNDAKMIGLRYKFPEVRQPWIPHFGLDKLKGLERILLEDFEWANSEIDKEWVRGGIRICNGGDRDIDTVFGGD